MTPTASEAHSRILLGILFMCGAGTVFPVMNGLVQVLSARYSSEQLVWARSLSHLIFILIVFVPRIGLWQLIRTSQPQWQIARSIALLSSTFLFFHGVKHLPLAKAASISFTSPFIVALLAWPMLGERASPKRLFTVLIGFAGVLVVIRPGSEVFQLASLFIVGSAICYAMYQVLTRRVAGHDRPETSAIYSVLVGTIVMSIVAPFHWIAPHSLVDGVLMFALGVCGGVGHYCVARALMYAPANIVAPFQYWQMVGSVAVGYLITGLFPDTYTWAGAAIIIGAGIYIGWSDTRRKT